jgi:hypothetical protein
MTISTRIIALAAGIVTAVGVTVGGAVALAPLVIRPNIADEQSSKAETLPDFSAPDTASAIAAGPYDVGAMLIYMVEEEKLARDVYVELGILWGTQVFERIASSEATHEDRVLTLLESQSLEDPRIATPGVFADSGLQALYNVLISSGSVSRDAALEVGVMIEERDIADLTDAISLTDDPAIVTVLESLRSASYNHLAAFERQLG